MDHNWLILYLENTNLEVIGMMRWQEPLDNIYHLTQRINNKDRVKIVYADLNDYASINRLFSENKPKYISHLAAQSYPKTSFNIPLETLQTNIIGTANILETIRQLKEKRTMIQSFMSVHLVKFMEGLRVNLN